MSLNVKTCKNLKKPKTEKKYWCVLARHDGTIRCADWVSAKCVESWLDFYTGDKHGYKRFMVSNEKRDFSIEPNGAEQVAADDYMCQLYIEPDGFLREFFDGDYTFIELCHSVVQVDKATSLEKELSEYKSALEQSVNLSNVLDKAYNKLREDFESLDNVYVKTCIEHDGEVKKLSYALKRANDELAALKAKIAEMKSRAVIVLDCKKEDVDFWAECAKDGGERLGDVVKELLEEEFGNRPTECPPDCPVGHPQEWRVPKLVWASNHLGPKKYWWTK